MQFFFSASKDDCKNYLYLYLVNYATNFCPCRISKNISFPFFSCPLRKGLLPLCSIRLDPSKYQKAHYLMLLVFNGIYVFIHTIVALYDTKGRYDNSG